MAFVMIVDDDEDFASSVATVMKADGHEVEIVLDTDTAVQRMEQRPPDLLVLDVMFPEHASGGFELARLLRHHNEKLKDTPILMLTAVNAKFPLGFSAADIDERWLPVSDFLEKPIDLEVLRARVASMLSASSPSSDKGSAQ